ncbi:hypothetical protein [Clostridium estertheticum]|uniref:hypothetical protein n=1 Tax=Clostridium estertheticum TaxID=238834 RepID=UPI001CF5E7BF|nr:hypothetical protein [Clostridium estertheticum]MCB2339073.1 hypothetical protein [Clostridium estertheticum]
MCSRDFVLLSKGVITMLEDSYLVRPYCRQALKKLLVVVKKCMKERSYKRVSWTIRQK